MQLRLGSGRNKRLSRSLTFLAVSSSSELTRSESFWHVRSNVNRNALLKYLRVRFIWGEFSPEELELCFLFPGFLKDLEFNVWLALLTTTELDRRQILPRMENALKLLGLKSNFRKELLPQWENNISIIADLESRPIGPRKAYSGWVRNASSVGSKRRGPSLPEPFSEDIPEQKFDEFNFLYELISVGRIETSLGIIRLP